MFNNLRKILGNIAKRFFDIICSLLGLIILAPFFIIIAILTKSTTHGPIFFKQVRVGRYGREFSIHKFRTMIADAESIGPHITIGNDSRITPIGQFLRKTKLDELPQLIDVLQGNMSLVGPRPEVPEYVKIYPQEIKNIVLSVRPGITDWASIKMIDESLVLAKANDPKQLYIDKILPEKLAYAVKYVKTRSFLTDVIIIFITIGKVLNKLIKLSTYFNSGRTH
ncbi:MAG TPA: sugar transferase [Aquella sp.]|nr:sugar transferase [Aquella sp.]